MSKKSRRARAKYRSGGTLPKKSPIKHTQSSKSTLAPIATASSVEYPSSSAQATQHHYVLPELRRIGIIAGALFLIIIVLTFVLG
ncbi:MAG: hypothetical protein SU899_02330 [Chloroflexota bacterium]|nr:hypothetical protein [Chloroflexota bacterium]